MILERSSILHRRLPHTPTLTVVILDQFQHFIIKDCTLVHLDRDVVSGNDIKVYPLARRLHNDYVPNKYAAIVTGGRSRNTHGDNVGLGTISQVDHLDMGINIDGSSGDRKGKAFGRYEPSMQMGPPDGDGDLTVVGGSLSASSLSGIFTDTTLLTAYEFGHLTSGDSGNPNFVILNNQLCLIPKWYYNLQ